MKTSLAGLTVLLALSSAALTGCSGSDEPIVGGVSGTPTADAQPEEPEDPETPETDEPEDPEDPETEEPGDEETSSSAGDLTHPCDALTAEEVSELFGTTYTQDRTLSGDPAVCGFIPEGLGDEPIMSITSETNTPDFETLVEVFSRDGSKTTEIVVEGADQAMLITSRKDKELIAIASVGEVLHTIIMFNAKRPDTYTPNATELLDELVD